MLVMSLVPFLMLDAICALLIAGEAGGALSFSDAGGEFPASLTASLSAADGVRGSTS